MSELLYTANSNVLELNELQDTADDSYINDATVTATLKDSKDADVPGETWPVTLDYVAGSNGVYRKTLSESIGIQAGQNYYAIVDVDAGAGRKGNWQKQLSAKVRRN